MPQSHTRMARAYPMSAHNSEGGKHMHKPINLFNNTISYVQKQTTASFYRSYLQSDMNFCVTRDYVWY